jgi:hypothetical protein
MELLVLPAQDSHSLQGPINAAELHGVINTPRACIYNSFGLVPGAGREWVSLSLEFDECPAPSSWDEIIFCLKLLGKFHKGYKDGFSMETHKVENINRGYILLMVCYILERIYN